MLQFGYTPSLVSSVHAAKRKILCNELRKKYRTSDMENFVFCDEMYVVAGETGYRQNERCFEEIWDLIHDDRKYRNKKKSPLRAMLYAAVCRDGRSRMIVLRSGFRLNQPTYIQHCLTPLIDKLLTSSLLEDAILYQSKAPCHA